MPNLRALFALLLPALLTACDDCTDMGCPSGLEIRLAREVTAPLTIEAFSTDPEGPRYVYTCEDRTRCNMAGTFLEDFFPTSINVRVTTGNRSATWTFQPSYETRYPNGKSCGGSCRNAKLDVPLP